jgi:tRNA(Ile)-lysidine synthase
MTEPWTPSPADIADLFAPLCALRRIVLAVSGGSDSIALLNLAALWRTHLDTAAPAIDVATVDHGLRPGSAAEAMAVAAAARSLGLPHHVLSWSGEKPTRAIQARARDARYRLLAALAEELAAAEPARGGGGIAIVTAHTADDQAETVLMRLARGSGPDGLRGMRRMRPLAPQSRVLLARPLLTVTRADLRSWLSARAIAWIEDPSNEDPRFERVRLRAAADTLSSLGLTASMLTLTARRQQRAVAALDAATDALMQSALDLNAGAFARLDGAIFAAAPEEIRVRLLQRVLAMFGGAAPRAELAQIERLLAEIAAAGAVRSTLGGCQVRACARHIRVFREAGRAALPEVTLEPGHEITWDGRFRIVSRAGRGGPALSVRALAPELFARLRRHVTPRPLLPARAAATLPAIWAGDRLLAVGGVTPAISDALRQDLREADERVALAVETRFLFETARRTE